MPLTGSGPLEELLSTPKPVHLFHYTGPAGAIGILKSRTLWAGRPADMNDATEQVLAHQYAQKILSSIELPARTFGQGMVQYALELIIQPGQFNFKGSRAYTVSLTSERDSLDQWRAYCPRSGGVALGFLTSHLADVAADQSFLLVPCVYDETVHLAIVGQIVEYHLDVWNERLPLETPRQGISSHLVRDLISDLERFAPILKHPSFAAEREWRLISPLVEFGSAAELIHVPSSSGIKQFQSFSLLTHRHPSIPKKEYELGAQVWGSPAQGFRPIIGPSLDPRGMEEAIRTLTPRDFGWIYSVERTESPYR